MKIVKQSVTLVSITKDPEKLIERFGRICWASDDKMTDSTAPEFVKKLKERGHHSVIEHASASFLIVTDRSICMEILRHRIASYSMSSTRYIRYNDEIPVVEPIGLNDDQFSVWHDACVESELNYNLMLSKGCSPQVARDVLPNCLAAELAMSCNFREWMHFIKLRGSKAAHPKIRKIAGMVLDILVKHAPNVFGDLEVE